MHKSAYVFAALICMQAVPILRAEEPMPDVRKLMADVREHQRALDKVRENYTFSDSVNIDTLDGKGNVKKHESFEHEVFYVNTHAIERVVKKDGKPLDAKEDEKETERIKKMVEKAEKTPPHTALDGNSISLTRMIEMMDLGNPRRVNFRGHQTIAFDFVGRKDAKTHGIAEDASKKLRGTVWVDEAAREIVHCEISFYDNFRIGGGLVASIEKGSNFAFDQELINHEVWLPTASHIEMNARALLAMKMRERVDERFYDYKKFGVETQSSKDARVVKK